MNICSMTLSNDRIRCSMDWFNTSPKDKDTTERKFNQATLLFSMVSVLID